MHKNFTWNLIIYEVNMYKFYKTLVLVGSSPLFYPKILLNLLFYIKNADNLIKCNLWV